jgi:hypothetical protein
VTLRIATVTTRSRLFRSVALLFAMLQMAMPGIASVADAWRAQDQRDLAPIHAEEHSEQACVPIHPEICALCEFAASCLPTIDAPHAAADVLANAEQVATRDVHASGAKSGVTARPRAPPVG